MGVAVITGAVAVIALAGLGWLQREKAVAASTADANMAALSGPPCPTATAAAYAAGPQARKELIFNDVKFGRAFGHVDCNEVANKATRKGSMPVCQFTGPGAVTVTTDKGVFYFATGIGKPATVSAPDGYRVVFALSELDPTLGNRQVLLVDRENGQPLPAGTGPWRLVVPSDPRPARWVREVNAIAVSNPQAARKDKNPRSAAAAPAH